MTDTAGTKLSRVLTVTVTTKSTGEKESTKYLYGSGLVSEQRGTLTLYHHYNHVGSTTELTDSNGRLAYAYSYGTYGELLSGDKTATRFLYNGQYGVSTDSNGLYYMRQRYYSPQIKRFINRDIVTGNPAESQSLNRYCYVQGNPVSLIDPFGLSPLQNPEGWLPIIHTVLDVVGCIPGPWGIAANLINAALYIFVDHDYFMGLMSLLACVTMGATKIAAQAGKAAKTAQVIEKVGYFLSNAASLAINANMFAGVGLEMWDKYYVNGNSLDEEFLSDLAQLGLSVLGMALSGNGMMSSGKNFESGTATINPNDIRFSQSSVNGASEIIDSMKVKGWDGAPIDVVRMPDGNLTTIDNTRVLAARYAEIDVQANVHAFDEVLPQDLDLIERLTTPKGVPQTWGDAVLLRIGKQNSGYRNTYPLGSNIIGWSGN